MDEKERGILRDHRVAIVADLEPRDVLTRLLDDGTITENDLELISEGQTRRQRCQRLLAMLTTRGPQAYGSFTHALSEDGYIHISQVLDQALTDSRTVQQHHLQEEEGSQHHSQEEGTQPGFTKESNKLKPPQEGAISPPDGVVSRRKKKRRKRKRSHRFATNCTTNSEEERSDGCRSNRAENFCGRCARYRPARFEDPGLKQLLERHCCLLVNNIEPRDITDYPYQERLLTDDECERIHQGATRKDRCSHLLHALATKRQDQNSVQILMKSLKKKYSYIVEKCCCVETGKERTSYPITITAGAARGNAERNANHTAEPMGSSRNDPELSRPVCDSSWSLTPTYRSAATGTVPKWELSNLTNGFRKCNLFDVGHQTSGSITRKTLSNFADGGHHIINETIGLFRSPSQCSEPSRVSRRRLVVAFDYMSSLINQGEYVQFENLTVNLGRKFQTDADMKYLLAYLQASRHLFASNITVAKQHVDVAMEIVPRTMNPKYATMEIFTAKTRIYLTQKKFKKLEDTLDDAKQIIESDPVGCSGRAAGWLYMNDGRNKTSQMGMLNFNKPSAISAYQKLFQQAKESFIRALSNFEKDGGKDGPFGAGYAACRLAILLLRCGDNSLTMDRMVPPSDDIRLAGEYLQRLEDSIPINKILSLQYLLAKSDYQYRKSNIVGALEHAQAAYLVAMELNLQEFVVHAHNRVLKLSMLEKRYGVTLKEVGDELEFKKLLHYSSDT